MMIEYDQFVDDMWFGPRSKEYAAIGMGGECGEVLNEIKKEMRDLKHDRRDRVIDEIGDTLYYLTRLAHLYHYRLPDIMEHNMKKLRARQLETGLPTKAAK